MFPKTSFFQSFRRYLPLTVIEMVVHLKHQKTEVKHMTFKEYYESTGPISLKEAISIIKKIDPEHDMTKTYKAESF